MDMATEHGWEYDVYSNPAFDFNFSVWLKSEKCERTDRDEPCTVVAATVYGANAPLQVPCFHCNNSDNSLHARDEFLGFYARRFAALLCEGNAGFPPRDAASVSNFFVSIVEKANNDSRRLHAKSSSKGDQPFFTVVHRVEFRVFQDEGRALRESLARAGITPKPAAADSVHKLMACKYTAEDEEMDRYESGWVASDHDCAICMEEIPTWRSSLAMECSHVFHKKCLLKWLKVNHVCPLCRYQMPTDHLSA